MGRSVIVGEIQQGRPGALDGVVILDLTHHIAGPFCTKLLADFGAQVIKIERPGLGDIARHLAPFAGNSPNREKSLLFLYLNNNKMGTTLDLKSESGRQIFKALLGHASVVVENFSPGTMERLGLGYADLAGEKPDIIMASLSNFGQTGPYRDFKTTNLVTSALSTAADANRGRPKEPLQISPSLTLYATGIAAAVAIVAAVRWRAKTGVGQYADISSLETAINLMRYPVTNLSFEDLGIKVPVEAYNRIMKAKDNYVGVNTLTQDQWELLCHMMEMPQILEDPRFITGLDRQAHSDELLEILGPVVARYPRDEYFHKAQEWRIPVSPVYSPEEMLQSPQYRARQFFVDVEHPEIVGGKQPGAPFKMSDSPWALRTLAPHLGEHNLAVYSGVLGYSTGEVTQLSELGVV